MNDQLANVNRARCGFCALRAVPRNDPSGGPRFRSHVPSDDPSRLACGKPLRHARDAVSSVLKQCRDVCRRGRQKKPGVARAYLLRKADTALRCVCVNPQRSGRRPHESGVTSSWREHRAKHTPPKLHEIASPPARQRAFFPEFARHCAAEARAQRVRLRGINKRASIPRLPARQKTPGDRAISRPIRVPSVSIRGCFSGALRSTEGQIARCRFPSSVFRAPSSASSQTEVRRQLPPSYGAGKGRGLIPVALGCAPGRTTVQEPPRRPAAAALE